MPESELPDLPVFTCFMLESELLDLPISCQNLNSHDTCLYLPVPSHNCILFIRPIDTFFLLPYCVVNPPKCKYAESDLPELPVFTSSIPESDMPHLPVFTCSLPELYTFHPPHLYGFFAAPLRCESAPM